MFVTKYSLHLPAAEQQRKTRAAIHAMDIPMKLVLAGGHGKQHDAAWNSQLLHPLDRCKTKSIKGHQSVHIWATRYRATSQSRNAQKRAQKRVGVKVTGHTFNVSIRVDPVSIDPRVSLSATNFSVNQRQKQCCHALLFINLFMSLSACTSVEKNNDKPKL